MPPECNDKRQAFVVRLVKPTEASTERLIGWMKSLSSASDIECWISVDNTFASSRDVRARLRQLQQAGWLRHTYNEKRMLAEYPELKMMLRVPAVRQALKHDGMLGCQRSLAWGFDVEALCVWWADVGRSFSHVWVFEDDVGYTGDISCLIDSMRSNQSDMVAFILKAHVQPSWHWFDAATRRFKRRFPEKRRKIREHVVRLSHALMQRLDASSKRGEIAW